jgi:integrase
MMPLLPSKERAVDLRQQLMEGRVPIPKTGAVIAVARLHPPFVVVDGQDVEVVAVTEYLRDLAVSDCSPATCRSYGFGLLRWFRLLWLLEVGWERATEGEVTVLVGWLRSAANPQRRRRRSESPPPGSVNLRTNKSSPAAGYAPRTINHALSVISGFYEFHAHHGAGPVLNPVPGSPQRRRALAHLSPLEPKPLVSRARFRQRVPDRPPRAIPDRLWDELFEAMGCERDRALLELAVSSGARAAELLGICPEDIDWAHRQVFVVSKGTRRREPVPASPQAFVRLARYFDEVGTPPAGESIWRTRRGGDRPLSYWALRRVLQRANALLGTNWSWHDLRHTAASRMANSGKLTLPEVQAILRHADITTTSRYLAVDVEDLFDALTEHYARPRPEPTYRAGYDPEDVKAVFGV